MPIRLSGMISGLDTDALVKELVSAYSTKKDKYVKQQTKLEWKQDAWKSLNTKTYSFYTGKLSNMRFSSNYSKKSVTSSDETKAKVSASSTAVNGTQKLKIDKLATTGYLTGAELQTGEGISKKKASYTGSTKLSDMEGFDGNGGNLTVKVDGKEKTFGLTGDMTINNVVAQLKDAGVNASFDETNQRFFISSKTSGAAHDFSLTGDAKGIQAMQTMGIFALSKADEAAYAATAASDPENLAKNEYLKVVVNAANEKLAAKNKALNDEISYLENKTGRDETLMNNITENNTAIREKFGLGEETEINSSTLEGLKARLGMLADDATDERKTEYNEKKALLDKAKDYLATREKYDTYQSNLGGGDAAARATTLKAQVTANEETMAANTELTKSTYTTSEFDSNKTIQSLIGAYTAENDETTYSDLFTKYQGLKETAQSIVNRTSTAQTSSATRITGENASIRLNDATFTSNTNNFSINGLTITALGVTAEDEPVTVTTETDVDGIYDMVKDFFKSYNEVMTTMQTAYNADSAKGYEPLTDDEKEAMSDDEVEKWEKKIKDALLRRDDTLSGIIYSMQTAMNQSYTIDGKTYSLSAFGISTGNYFSTDAKERGSYHIDGDKDDAVSAGNNDKLKAAIAADPDNFVAAFSKITGGLYDTLTKKMSASSVSSAYTLYNDKSMKTQYKELKTTISDWEEKISKYEEKYYKQFSAMETAMSKLQSQTSSLTGMLG